MPSTTIFSAGELLLIGFPFSMGSQLKTRPVMVVLDSGDADIVVARVTTQQHQTPYDVSISDWHAAGLLAPSIVRLHKLATLEKSLMHRKLGHIQNTDRVMVAAVLKQAFGQW